MIAYSFGVILILGGVGMFATAPPSAPVFIVAGVLSLPVIRKIIAEKGLRLNRWASVAIVIVLLIIGMGVAAPYFETSEEERTHELGERFVVDGQVAYTVEEVEMADRIGSGVLEEQAEGIYLVVTPNIENVGGETLDFSDRHMKMLDSDDNQFEANFGVSSSIDQDPWWEHEGVVYEELQPNLEITRIVVFDVNPGDDYRLKLEPVGILSDGYARFVPVGAATSES